jgi:hypothetical protein
MATPGSSRPESADANAAAEPVFVGGTGRSGTTIVGALIAEHPRYAGLPFEVRAHISAAEVTVRKKRTMEWMREQTLARHRSHLHQILDENALIRLLDRFEEGIEDGVANAAAKEFISGVMGPVAEREGKPGWVEMTPLNSMWTSWLLEAFPGSKHIHMLRDGRDVAVSVAAAWGRQEAPEALDWWGRRIARIAEEIDGLPADSVLTVDFEQLVRDQREEGYLELIEFLGLEADRSTRRFFEQQMVADRANIGRWRRDLDREEQAALSEQYERILESLSELQIGWLSKMTERV